MKVVKHKKKIENKVSSVIKFGQGFERLIFFFLTLLLVCHLISCMWIYVGKTSEDENVDKDSWIELNNFGEESVGELYTISMYFTM